MKRSGGGFFVYVIFVYVIPLLVTAVAVQTAAAANEFDKPVEYAPLHVDGLQPDILNAEGLQGGLGVIYYLEYFERDINAIPDSGPSRYKRVTGKPILELNHQFDKEDVFDSGTNRGVALRMDGYLHLVDAGDYQFQALSNDGVRVTLNGKTIIDDHEQHSDRLSNVGYVPIERPGYYAVEILYFQRKGTAALKLFWKSPGADDFVPIPQNVYVHLP